MSECPSCGAHVPAGETICLDCGTELVVAMDFDDEPEPTAETERGEPAAEEGPRSCPDCGETVRPDRNGFCPMCGHDFGSLVEIDEDEFFREPPSLEEVRRKKARELRDADREPARRSDRRPSRAPRESAPPATRRRPRPDMPLPGDRRHRYRDSGEEPARDIATPMLVVEGGQKVFFEGRMVHEIPLDFDELLIGRRDPAKGHYPDIDLAHFRHIDGHISRRHARILRRGGKWVIEDLCDNDATFVNDQSHVLNRDTAVLEQGDRILISDSVAMTFRWGAG